MSFNFKQWRGLFVWGDFQHVCYYYVSNSLTPLGAVWSPGFVFNPGSILCIDSFFEDICVTLFHPLLARNTELDFIIHFLPKGGEKHISLNYEPRCLFPSLAECQLNEPNGCCLFLWHHADRLSLLSNLSLIDVLFIEITKGQNFNTCNASRLEGSMSSINEWRACVVCCWAITVCTGTVMALICHQFSSNSSLCLLLSLFFHVATNMGWTGASGDGERRDQGRVLAPGDGAAPWHGRLMGYARGPSVSLVQENHGDWA